MKNINYSWMMNESISYVVFKIPFFKNKILCWIYILALVSLVDIYVK